MLVQHKVELLIKKIELWGKLICIWPDDQNAKIGVQILRQCGWFIYTTTMALRVTSLFMAVYYDSEKPCAILVETLSIFTVSFQNFLAILLWKYNQNKLRVLFGEIVDYVRSARRVENDLFYNKLHFYIPGCICNAVFCLILTVAFCVDLIFSNKPISLSGWYPFAVNASRYFMVSTFVIFSTLRVACISATVPLVHMVYFSYAITRMELVCNQLQSMKNEKHLITLIEEHKKCIRFVQQYNSAVRFIILGRYATTMILVIFTGMIAVLNNNVLSVFRSGLAVLISLLCVFFPTWFADDLYMTSQKIPWAIYDSNWTNFSVKTSKSIIIMIARAQREQGISVNGFMPILTKRLYGSFLSMILSYYMALRALFKS